MSMGTIIPMAMQMGSGALKAYGASREGSAAASGYRQAAQVESDVLRQNARQVGAESSRREELIRQQTRGAMGEQAAAMAQAGIAGAGTSVGVMDQSRIDAELDALNARYEGQTKADTLMSDARNTLIAGENRAEAAKSAGGSGALKHLMEGVAGAYGIYAKLNPATEEAEGTKEADKTEKPYRDYDPNMAFGSNPRLYKGKH